MANTVSEVDVSHVNPPPPPPVSQLITQIELD